MEQLKFIVAAIAIFGGVIDFLTKRIPNWWTFPAMVAGIAAQGWLGGGIAGAGAAALGLGVGLALFLPLYIFGMMGAGDVKLLMAIGAWSNARFVVAVAITAIFVGGAYAVVDVIRARRVGAMTGNFLALARSLTVRGLPRPVLDIDRERRFSFGVALALAVVLVIALEGKGVLP